MDYGVLTGHLFTCNFLPFTLFSPRIDLKSPTAHNPQVQPILSSLSWGICAELFVIETYPLLHRLRSRTPASESNDTHPKKEHEQGGPGAKQEPLSIRSKQSRRTH